MKPTPYSTIASNYSRLFIYESELDYISRCILDYPNIETGGNLFGHYTKNGIPIIEYVIGPGEDAIHEKTKFKQGEKYLKAIYGYVSEAFALSEIGAWHSHHQLALPHPSSGDVCTVINGLKESNLEEFIILIGGFTPTETPINAFVFNNNPKTPYKSLEWHILKGVSPFRERVDKFYPDVLLHPKTTRGKYEKKEYQVFEKQHWLSDKSNIEELKVIVSFIKQKTDNVKILHPEGSIIIAIHCLNQNINIIFPDTFSLESYFIIKISNSENELLSEKKVTIDISNNISESVIENIKDIV